MQRESNVNVPASLLPTELSSHSGTDHRHVPKEQRDRRPWPKDCTLVVTTYLQRLRQSSVDEGERRAELKAVITQLVGLTGYSRERCWRFARRLGVNGKQPYREWTKSDQQRLFDLISRNPTYQVAKIMRRSPGSIRAMLHRLGASAQMGRDWFTIYTLAQALHTRATEVQSWIDRGWLKTRTVETGRLHREIIEADAFAEFCKRHSRAVVGRRLRADRLEFVKSFVFPPSHTDLLPVRDSKRERAAFDSLANGPEQPQADAGEDSGTSAA
jgi:hypothetical protein